MPKVDSRLRSGVLGAVLIMASTAAASGQSLDPLGYSVATPRPISPAEGTTTPSAQATQRQNPYLGSVPSKNTGTRIELSLKGAIERGLRYNLGLIESNQASADVRSRKAACAFGIVATIVRERRAKDTRISVIRRSASSCRRFRDCPRYPQPAAPSDTRTPESVSRKLCIAPSFAISTVHVRATNRRHRWVSRIRAT